MQQDERMVVEETRRESIAQGAIARPESPVAGFFRRNWKPILTGVVGIVTGFALGRISAAGDDDYDYYSGEEIIDEDPNEGIED